MSKNMEVNEINILKAAIANFVDTMYGSMKGMPEDQRIEIYVKDLNITPAMARVIIEASDEVVDAMAFNII